MSEEGFRGPQVCKIVGITYRQLDHWDRTGLKSPSLVKAKGSGTQRLYSYSDVLELRVIKQLLDAGVTLQRARKAVEFLRESGEELAAANLVIGAAGPVLVHDSGELLDVLRGGQGVFNVIGLGGVVDEIDAAIVELSGGAAEPARDSSSSVPPGHALGQVGP
jgi:DNA-binding transcriptional MerR regulator